MRNMNIPKQISLPYHLADKAMDYCEEMQIGFSKYVQDLIEKDLRNYISPLKRDAADTIKEMDK
jgi:hypothetical protein